MFAKQSVTFLTVSLMVICSNVHGYNGPLSKESIFADVLLTELLNRMDKDVDGGTGVISLGQNYFDLDTDLPVQKNNVDLVSRSSKNSANIAGGDDYNEYRNIFGGASNPSLRDQEFLQHSSLWGHQYVSGGMGEVPNRYNTIVKSDASLPAYCNPPNPCPYGYEDTQGCISDFENTAIFSREFQAAQECTCDSEHMFDCAGQDSSSSGFNGEVSNDMNSALMEKFLIHQFENENVIENSNAVVKKTFPMIQRTLIAENSINNPFLQGEKLPIAAKKGQSHF